MRDPGNEVESNIDADVLSRLPLDPSEYMEDCTVEMERDVICATILAVIHQEEDATPWMAAVSARVGIVHAEPAIMRSQIKFSDNLLQKKYNELNGKTPISQESTGISPIRRRAEKRDSYNILLLESME